MNIQRIDNYIDNRFSDKVLKQHGGYLIDEKPYEVEIISHDTAIVRGWDKDKYMELIEEFRFHAPHIIRFVDDSGSMIHEYQEEKIFDLDISQIQPSQFFVDEEKLEAIRTFIHTPENVVIQVIKWNDRHISLDGHTRLYCAMSLGFSHVCAVISETDDWVWTFVEEAQRRGIYSPGDMKLLSHEEYDILWNQYCNSVFGEK